MNAADHRHELILLALCLFHAQEAPLGGRYTQYNALLFHSCNFIP